MRSPNVEPACVFARARSPFRTSLPSASLAFVFFVFFVSFVVQSFGAHHVGARKFFFNPCQQLK